MYWGKGKKLVLGAAMLALAVPVAACGEDKSDSGGGSTSGSKDKGSVAVLLPDSKSSTRWETVDRPFLKEAFDAADERFKAWVRDPANEGRPISDAPDYLDRIALDSLLERRTWAE